MCIYDKDMYFIVNNYGLKVQINNEHKYQSGWG